MIRPTFLQESRAILCDDLQRLRGDLHAPPRASIAVPVDAQKDLLSVLAPGSDIAAYCRSQLVGCFLRVRPTKPATPFGSPVR